MIGVRLLPALIGALLGCLAGPAASLAAPPRSCPGPAAYAGPPLRTPAIAPAFAARPAETRPLDEALSRRLDQALVRAQAATAAPSMTAAVMIPGQGHWQGDWPAPSGAPGPLLFWASAGKTFTAVAILQLADEGRLSLDDPISKWISGVPNGGTITLRQLLDHTSGLFSANEDPGFRRRPHRLTLDETLAILGRHDMLFCPGENWRYSNSGYGLLGTVLERVGGRPYDQVIRDRIISRLGPVRLRVITEDDALADLAPPLAPGGEPAIDPREPGAAGAIAGDAAGMIAFWRALLGGELLSPAATRAMFERLYPMFGGPESYGQGVMTYQLPAPPGGAPAIWVGHSGGAPGVKAVVAYSVTQNAFVAVALTGDGSAEATANLLLSQIGAPP